MGPVCEAVQGIHFISKRVCTVQTAQHVHWTITLLPPDVPPCTGPSHCGNQGKTIAKPFTVLQEKHPRVPSLRRWPIVKISRPLLLVCHRKICERNMPGVRGNAATDQAALG